MIRALFESRLCLFSGESNETTSYISNHINVYSSQKRGPGVAHWVMMRVGWWSAEIYWLWIAIVAYYFDFITVIGVLCGSTSVTWRLERGRRGHEPAIADWFFFFFLSDSPSIPVIKTYKCDLVDLLIRFWWLLVLWEDKYKIFIQMKSFDIKCASIATKGSLCIWEIQFSIFLCPFEEDRFLDEFHIASWSILQSHVWHSLQS
jgi:hypothetical protein